MARKLKKKKRTQDSRPRTQDAGLRKLAAELKSIAAMDSKFDELFDLEKYPRVKTALERAVAQRVEEIIKEKFSSIKKRDYRRVSLQQLIEITKKGRRTIYFWLAKGLSREDDGFFWLPKFFEWYEKYMSDKIYDRLPAQKMNPYQLSRVQKLKMDIARQQNQLLERPVVIAGQVARHQNLVNSFTNKAEELAIMLAGLPQAQIQKQLNEFFDEILRQQCSVGEELCLPEKQNQKLKELLSELEN